MEDWQSGAKSIFKVAKTNMFYIKRQPGSCDYYFGGAISRTFMVIILQYLCPVQTFPINSVIVKHMTELIPSRWNTCASSCTHSQGKAYIATRTKAVHACMHVSNNEKRSC